MNNEFLKILTDRFILHKGEREKLKTLAQKITKVPDIIHIPSEYLTGKKSGV